MFCYLQSTDADIGIHGIVWYDILSVGDPFAIDRETGELRTTGLFVTESGKKYEVRVEAEDNQGQDPSLKNDTTITVSDWQ